MNIMAKIANMYNKKMDEPFNIIDKKGEPVRNNPHRFTVNGIMTSEGEVFSFILQDMLTGTYQIEPTYAKPLDKMPEYGDQYKCVRFNSRNPNGIVGITKFVNSTFGYMCFNTGNMFSLGAELPTCQIEEIVKRIKEGK